MLAQAIAQPRRADLAIALALRALEERREEDVTAAVARTASLTPGDPTLLHVLGLLHRAVGDLAAAITAFDAALPRAPTSVRLVHARARAAAEAGLPSLDWYARARALSPNDPEIVLGQVAALHEARDDRAAQALLIGFLQQYPEWVAGHATLIRLRTMIGAGAAAMVELDRALARRPRDATLNQLKIVGHLRGEDAAAARAALAAARRTLGDTPDFRRLDAMVATEFETIAVADAAFARLASAVDDDLTVYWLRHLLRRGEPERVAALHGTLPESAAAQAWPYLSLAWRLTGDPLGRWLDRADCVRVVDFGADWPLLAPLAETLRGLHRATRAPLDQSVRGGTQTDGPLLSRVDPVIRAARDRMTAEVARYVADLPPRDPAHPLLGRVPRHPRFVGSWSVRLQDGGFHTPHIHGEGWLSSAFYVALPEPRGEEGWLTLGAPQPSLGLALPATRTIEPRPGRLVLFPSTSWHGTLPFTAGERLTMAFDIA